jgi:hypothetical protein
MTAEFKAGSGAIGALLLDDLTATLKRFMVLSDGEPEALALWCMQRHSIEAWYYSMRLVVTSKTYGSGKTALWKILSRLCAPAKHSGKATPAAIKQFFDKHKKTPHALFIDESDTFVAGKYKKDVENVMNLGYERGITMDNSVLTDKGNWTGGEFEPFGPAGIAGVGESWTWKALLSRALHIRLTKAKPPEKYIPHKHDKAVLDPLCERAAAWCKDHKAALAAAEMDMPANMEDDPRAQEKWWPLVAVADLAGGRWPKLARQLAQRFTGFPVTTELEEIAEAAAAVFERSGTGFIPSTDLCAAVAQETGGRLQPDPSRLKEALGAEPKRTWREGRQVRGYFAKDIPPPEPPRL